MDSDNSDQTRQMPRLICVFAGCTCHFVGFVMLRLKWLLLDSSMLFQTIALLVLLQTKAICM